MSAVPMEHDVEDGTLITAGGLARLEQELEDFATSAARSSPSASARRETTATSPRTRR